METAFGRVRQPSNIRVRRALPGPEGWMSILMETHRPPESTNDAGDQNGQSVTDGKRSVGKIDPLLWRSEQFGSPPRTDHVAN